MSDAFDDAGGEKRMTPSFHTVKEVQHENQWSLDRCLPLAMRMPVEAPEKCRQSSPSTPLDDSSQNHIDRASKLAQQRGRIARDVALSVPPFVASRIAEILQILRDKNPLKDYQASPGERNGAEM